MIKIGSILSKDIEQYCQLNGLDKTKYVNDILRKAFMLDKYGDRPQFMQKKKVEPKIISYILELPRIDEKNIEIDGEYKLEKINRNKSRNNNKVIKLN